MIEIICIICAMFCSFMAGYSYKKEHDKEEINE